MISTMRTKFGPIVIGGIIGLIAFVFIFYGIFMPGKGGGMSGPGIAGEVNGEPITFTEFSRAVNQRTEFIKSMMGGKMDEEQIAKFGIREAVFKDLAQRKLLVQVAKKEGFYPSIDEVREHILNMDVFKKDGRFDKIHYKEVLNQNGYSATRFEELIAQEIVEQQFKSFLSNLAAVPPESVESDLKKSKERRKLKYVYLDHESIRKTMPKDMKPDEMNKKLPAKVDELTASVEPLLGAGQDKKIEALLKPFNMKVKTSDWLTPQSDFIPGVGSIASAHGELFAMKKGEKAKKFSLMGGTLVASVADAESYDASKVTAKERADALSRLENQRQSEVMGELINFWYKKATVSRNDDIVVGKGGRHVSPTEDQ